MFATMGASVKAASSSLPNEMLVFMRNLFGLFVVLPLLFRHRVSWRSTVLPLHVLRASLGLASMYCFFYALGQLQLADGVLLKMTAPLFMPLIAWWWLREEAGRLAMFALPLGFAGVVFVLEPAGQIHHAAWIGLLGGFLAAGSKVTVRRLSLQEPVIRIVFYFALLSALISAVPLLWHWQTPEGQSWWLLVLMGVAGTLGQLLLTRGYALGKAARMAPFTYFSVVFAALLGFIFWDETLRTSFVIGTALIVVAGVMVVQGRRASPISLP